MSKAKDFSDDLASVERAVTKDVDAILRVVQSRDERVGDSPTREAKLPLQSQNDVIVPSTRETQSAPQRQRTKSRQSVIVEQSDAPVAIENVTTRLRRDTNELLTEAALRQKLKKEKPSTRQDIVETALQEWFERKGYSLTPSGE